MPDLAASASDSLTLGAYHKSVGGTVAVRVLLL